jgi:hypothetical protein
MSRTIEYNPDGCGSRTHICHEVENTGDYWASVTDIDCPVCDDGIVRWDEAGYVPGHRTCDKCHVHFMAKELSGQPILIQLKKRS